MISTVVLCVSWAQVGGSPLGSFMQLESAWLELESSNGSAVLDIQDGAIHGGVGGPYQLEAQLESSHGALVSHSQVAGPHRGLEKTGNRNCQFP